VLALAIVNVFTICAAEKAVLWRDPGEVEKLDFVHGQLGEDGAPQSPFVFHEEEGGGTAPKIIVQDNSRRMWSVKWGNEVSSEVFASRLLWAVGYISEPSYFVRHGKIDSVGQLGRAAGVVNRANGNSFNDARFELRPMNPSPAGKAWMWKANPFLDSKELAGLKIMMMLVSNWDAKDASDSSTNTAVHRLKNEEGEELLYLIDDWGASMGKWGNVATREKWDCRAFAAQTESFVKGIENGYVRFGFTGKHASDLGGAITVDDVRWLMQYLGRVTDQQLRDGLTASGATPKEVACFAGALRNRIEQLRRVAASQTISRAATAVGR
jgi:hypothetical protein